MKSTEIKVRGYHCDAYGHVNNARYLEFLEEGRWEFLQPAVGQGVFEDLGLLFVVVHIDISYKQAIVPNDLIQVKVCGIRFNNMSIVLQQQILKNDLLCNEASITFVLLDKNTERPVPIDASIQSIFNNLMNE